MANQNETRPLTDQEILSLLAKGEKDSVAYQTFVSSVPAFITRGEHPVRAVELAVMLTRGLFDRAGLTREVFQKLGALPSEG